MRKTNLSRNGKRIALFTCIGLLLSIHSMQAADYNNEYRSYDGTDQKGFLSEEDMQKFVMALIILLPIGAGIFIYFSVHSDQEPDDEVPILNVIKSDDHDIVSEIQKVDPHFSENEFKQFAVKRILQLQKALSEKDFNTLKYLDTELLYLSQKALLENLADRTCYMEFQKIKGMAIEGFHRSLGYDTITVVCYMSLIEFTKNAQGALISGSNSTAIEHTYAVEFQRPLGKPAAGLENCPNCGAPLDIDEAGKCAYCHTTIVKKHLDWMINRYEIR